MPRKIIPYSTEYPCHISVRTNNKEFFKLPMENVWDIYSNYLYFLNKAYNFNIHLFILMNNHFHLMTDTPEANIGEGMNYFLRETSKVIGKFTGTINHLYGGRYYKSLITTQHYYNNVYKYCYQNPVRAGLVKRCEDYPYSTLRGLLGFQKMCIPLAEDQFLFNSNTNYFFQWINQPYGEAELRLIRAGLVKTTFEIRRHQNEYIYDLLKSDALSLQK